MLINLLRKKRPSYECFIGKHSVIYDTAEIINNLHDKHTILIGDYTHIRGQLLTFGHDGDIKIGDYCYVGANTYIWSAKKISIGNRVLISHNCSIFDNDTHPLDPIKRHEQFKAIITSGHPKIVDLHEEAVTIEDDVLIGAGSIVLKGVTIHKGAVVGAGSVVIKDIPSYCVVVGNPAKIIRKLKNV